MAEIAIIGSGGFGLSLALLCHNKGHKVTVWSKFQDEIDTILRTGELKAKLPGVIIPKDIKLTTDISCVFGKVLIVVGIPSAFVRSVCTEAALHIDSKTIVVSTAKGLEEGTFKRMSEVVSECMPDNTVVALTGPSHAEEVARGIPTTIVAACDDIEAAKYVQRELSGNNMRIYVSDDAVGCEIGGALKNIIALAAGICDGLGYGDNTKAALMTRGMREISRLGLKLGGKLETFYGLTGMGDMIVTCTSMHSRNRRAGILIGKGVKPADAIRQVGTVEGYFCTKTAHELSQKVGVSMPIVNELYDVLESGKDVNISLSELMLRPYVSENN